jgi:hypothetical protein
MEQAGLEIRETGIETLAEAGGQFDHFGLSEGPDHSPNVVVVEAATRAPRQMRLKARPELTGHVALEVVRQLFANFPARDLPNKGAFRNHVVFSA